MLDKLNKTQLKGEDQQGAVIREHGILCRIRALPPAQATTSQGAETALFEEPRVPDRCQQRLEPPRPGRHH